MAHFVRLDENNIVTEVIVVGNDKLINPETASEDESFGIAFCESLYGGKWIQTSYNNNFRKRYAGIGYSYDGELDIFISPKPYPSWIFDNYILDWISPIGNSPELTEEQRQNNSFYEWDETGLKWILIEPPTI